MEELLENWAGETIITQVDKRTGASIFIALFSTRYGPAGGGTRMKHYPSKADALADAMRLAEGMAFKFAVPQMGYGGAKAVIALPDRFDPAERDGLLRRYGRLVKQLGGLFITGPDVGTDSRDMNIIGEECGALVFGRTPDQGGAGATGPATAIGLFHGLLVGATYLFGTADLGGRRVLVQGVGSVGGRLISFLREAGAEVLFSDVDAALIERYQADGLEFVPPAVVYETECDIFSPCALGEVLNSETIPQLRCKMVAGGANNQLAVPSDADLLHERGIFYLPDYVLNVGGAMYTLRCEVDGAPAEQANREVGEAVAKTMRELIQQATETDRTIDAVARERADKRLNG